MEIIARIHSGGCYYNNNIPAPDGMSAPVCEVCEDED